MNSNIGRLGTDNITGFSGRITGRCEYITGCNQLLISPETKEGAYVEPHWFDEQRVAVSGDQLILPNEGSPGPDKAAPKR